MSKNITLHDSVIKQKFAAAGHVINRYKSLLFFLLLAFLYGFILMRINTLSKIEPSAEQVTTIKKTTIKIPESTVNKMKSLKDNSVRVQSLFDEARDNPF